MATDPRMDAALTAAVPSVMCRVSLASQGRSRVLRPGKTLILGREEKMDRPTDAAAYTERLRAYLEAPHVLPGRRRAAG